MRGAHCQAAAAQAVSTLLTSVEQHCLGEWMTGEGGGGHFQAAAAQAVSALLTAVEQNCLGEGGLG